ncbi:hypothetical protein ACH5RR_018339 [Cinchona calisaya]|uniref:Uncharacterized protein n=1 Tax=Cinchona calisaya TaxID=153742 RepID=A0ABD2ZL64_9GENT
MTRGVYSSGRSATSRSRVEGSRKIKARERPSREGPIEVIGQALWTTSLSTLVQLPQPPLWHYGLLRGQSYYTSSAVLTQQGEAQQAGGTSGTLDEDFEESQHSEAENDHEVMEQDT